MAEAYKDGKDAGETWLQRVIQSQERERKWRDDARDAEKAYAQDDKAEGGKLYDFNILHSNVETIVPALYNSTPVPDIRRRFNDKDPLAKQYAEILERIISIQIDDNRLDAEVERQTQDAFLAGRGIIRLRFDADEVEETSEGEIEPVEGVEPVEGEEAEAVEAPAQIKNERVTLEAVSWRDFAMGKAQRWRDVPWVAFRHQIDRQEYERLSNSKLYSQRMTLDDGKPYIGPDTDEIYIWEVWCKRSRTVKFIKAEDGEIIAQYPDPLGLTGFFPMAEPVQPVTVTGNLTPVCPFVIYKRLADELDRITKRINKIVEGMKVRGIMAGSANGDIANLAEAGDNEIIIASNLEQLAMGGLDKAISWWPVDKAAQVVRELFAQREQVKSAIYEITGISDIVRGASDAGETATAQQIKTQWGSLRIQKMQRLIQRQVRDIFVIMAEIITTKFSPQRISEMTGQEMTPELLMMFNEPVLSSYRVDIESDSTIRADLTRAKGEMGEFLQGTASYFQTMAPLVQSAPAAAEPITEIYAAFARYFSLGKQAEDALDNIVELAKQAAAQFQEPQGPTPEEIEAQARANEAALRQQEAQMKIESKFADAEAKQAQTRANVEAKQAELAMKQEEHRVEMEKMRQEMQMAQREHALEMQKAMQEWAGRVQASTPAPAPAPAPPPQENKEMARVLEAMMQNQAIIAQSVSALGQSVNKPRRLVKDKAGEIIGME